MSAGAKPFWMLPKRVARLGAVFGCLSLPVAAYGIYDRSNPFPSPLNQCDYPLMARYYIRKALWTENVKEKAYNLDWAMQKVLSAGYGPASPQSTALVMYLSQIYLDERPPKLENLTASYAALTHKPHVGEGVKEERARLELSFQVAATLCSLLAKSNPEGAAEFAKRALATMDKAPPFLSITQHATALDLHSSVTMSKHAEADTQLPAIVSYSVGSQTGNIFFTLSRGTKTWNEDAALLCDQNYILYLNWKHAHVHGPPNHPSTVLHKSSPALPTMAANFINGHIAQGDFDAALSVLNSEEFVDCDIPPFVFTAFINEGILKVEDGMLLDRLTRFLINGLRTRRLCADLAISKGNIIHKGEEDVFWCAFESLRSIVSMRRAKLIKLLNELIAMSDALVTELLQTASDDRYHGFKYICRSLIALYKAATSPSEKEDICQIISNLVAKASRSRVYRELVENLYHVLSDESLSILSPLLMILEKKCHLCLDPQAAANMPTSGRILAILSSLKDRLSDPHKSKKDSTSDIAILRMLLLSWRTSIIMPKESFPLLPNDALVVEESVLSKINMAIHKILHLSTLSPHEQSLLITIIDAFNIVNTCICID